jgi:glycerol-3-phosphate cytidylyltransferase
MAKSSKIILTYGTFDLFHRGHVAILRRARELGTKLIVGLSTDEFNLSKGKVSCMDFNSRREILESCRYVDMVIPEESWDQKIFDIQNNDVDIFVMGDDWRGHFDHLKNFCSVTYFERTAGISTTMLKSMLKINSDEVNYKSDCSIDNSLIYRS